MDHIKSAILVLLAGAAIALALATAGCGTEPPTSAPASEEYDSYASMVANAPKGDTRRDSTCHRIRWYHNHYVVVCE